MKEPAISVIVPVYKAEKYLHRCIDSLLAQTFQDFEVLLVDDGSPDKSGEICDEYAKKDSRVRVFHKANGGVSSARQCGMDNARGEYTIHADPDDWVEPEMLEALYKKAKEEDADMVVCDYYINYRRKQIYKQQKPNSLNHDAVMRQLLLQQLHGACWNKLVRRKLIIEFAISFPLDMTIWEDLYVNCCILMHDVKVCYLERAFYHYDNIINENSLVRSCSKDIIFSMMIFVSWMEMNLNNLLYKRELDKVKCMVKLHAFSSLSIPEKDFLHLYEEINSEFTSYYLTPFCVRISVNGHYTIAKGIYKIVRCLQDLILILR